MKIMFGGAVGGGGEGIANCWSKYERGDKTNNVFIDMGREIISS